MTAFTYITDMAPDMNTFKEIADMLCTFSATLKIIGNGGPANYHYLTELGFPTQSHLDKFVRYWEHGEYCN